MRFLSQKLWAMPRPPSRIAPRIPARVNICDLLELGVFRFGFLEDGNIGVSIFPKGKEILIRSLCFRRIPGNGVGAAQAQLGERMLGNGRSDCTMIYDFLKFRYSLRAALRPQVGQP